MRKIAIFCLLLQVNSRLVGQVNNQTGSAIYSLPMFDWQDDKSHLTIAVALNYNSGNGLKVTDIASNIGQGWNLMAGGVITRMQVGEPDDQMPRDGAVEDNWKYPAGYLYDPKSANLGCPGYLTHYPIFGDQNHIYKQNNTVVADKQLDYFSFRFNSKTGLFVLGKNNGDVGVLLENSNLKVWFKRNNSLVTNTASGSRTTIDTFFIKDENGIRYTFSRHEQTTVFETDYCNSVHTTPLVQPTFKNNTVYYDGGFPMGTVNNNQANAVNLKVINSWYLSDIWDSLANRSIHLNYTDVTITNSAGSGMACYQSTTANYALISRPISQTITPEISSIVMPDGHSVVFNYGAPRIDLSGDFRMSSIDIKYNGRYVSRYNLNTSYFIYNRYGNPSIQPEKDVARLCLISVQKMGTDLRESDNPYVFDYYRGSSAPDDFVPPPFFYAKDIWGFFNGDYSKDYYGNSIPLSTQLGDLTYAQVQGLCFLRSSGNALINPKPGYAKNGLLKSITYPAGGNMLYTYVQNTGLLNGVNTTIGGVHVASTTVSDGGYSNGCNNPLVTTYTFSSDPSNTQSSIWGIEMPVNTDISYGHFAAESKYVKISFPVLVSCKYRYLYPGILSRNQAITLTGHQEFMQALSTVLGVISAVTEILDVVNLYLDYTPAYLVAVILDIIGTVVIFWLSCESISKDTQTIAYFNADLRGNNPLPEQFKRVEVSRASGGRGKTVFEYTSDTEDPIWLPTNPYFSMEQRFPFWSYGLLKKMTEYDSLGIPIKQIENIYSYTKTNNSSAPNYPYISYQCKVSRDSSQRSDNWSNIANYDAPDKYVLDGFSNAGLTARRYDILSGKADLITSYERYFKSGSSTIYNESVTQYGYNSAIRLVNQITKTGSNGDQTIQKIAYSNDYNTGILNSLVKNNMVSVPVSSNTSIIRYNTSTQLMLDEKVTEFTTAANGNILPYRILEQRFSQPTAGAVTYLGPGNAGNPVYQQVKMFSYDATGNLIGSYDEGNRTVTNIYDYSDKYIVATITNADPVTDKCAYSSFETIGLGGWNLTGTSGVSTAAFITGNQSFILSGANSLSTTLNTAKASIVSFWATSGSVTVSGGATLKKSSPTINGFTYYEYNVPAGNASVMVAGTGTIDELRAYPQTARMRTVTYDPMVGKTTEADENNRLLFYQYDDLQRLRFIKDDYGNIVKMYEYNYKIGTTASCPVTYYNNSITEMFFPNNCAATSLPLAVPVNIPAGRYSSTVSQLAADLLAENDLIANGQTYANGHAVCIPRFSNHGRTVAFSKDGAPFGSKGTSLNYTVPASRYLGISQAAADSMENDEILANGQAIANIPGNTSYITDTAAIWVGTGAVQCEVISGGQTGYQQLQAQDQNPNSITYNTYKWVDTGMNTSACPITSPSCSLVAASGWATYSSTATKSGTTITFNWTMTCSIASSLTWSSQNNIGLINGPCSPSVQRTQTISENGRTWTLYINPTGSVNIMLTGGAAPTSSSVIALTGTYSL